MATLEFQICDWNHYHEVIDDAEVYMIQLFGRTEDDKDVCLKVTDFHPFFYISIPQQWNKMKVDTFIKVLKDRVCYGVKNRKDNKYSIKRSLIKHELVYRHKFYGFDNKKLHKFVQLTFNNYNAMRAYSNYLNKPFVTDDEKPIMFKLKESNIEPHPHIRLTFDNYNSMRTYTNYLKKTIVKEKTFELHESDVEPYIQLTFDNYNAMMVYSNYLKKRIVKEKATITFELYESNIEPHIRFMHINQLTSCGWVSIDVKRLTSYRSYSTCDHSYHVKCCHVKPAANQNRVAPFKIMGYDIECISCDENFPQASRVSDKVIQIGMTLYRYGSMTCYEQHILTLKKCAAIEGATVECYKTERRLLLGFAEKVAKLRPDFMTGYNTFGFDDSYIYDRLNCLGSVKAEQGKLVDVFLRKMGKLDNAWIMTNEEVAASLTEYVTRQLSSSAIGDTLLKYFHVPGIVTIDMLKVIQREHSLESYKLDSVAANFIKEKSIKFVEHDEVDGLVAVDVHTVSTKALETDAYIQIMVDDGYSPSPLIEDAKYKVTDVTTIENNGKSCQCIRMLMARDDVVKLREAQQNKLVKKIFWTFAKDDMHHTLINENFRRGDAYELRTVAKYCLKDCKLVNLLLAKLEIIVKNIGMANVCHVPLSYIFLRGQGVKILSLISKKCRDRRYVIPTLKKCQGIEDETTYKGATVITPKPAVYRSPIGVLDYSSLYPNSMREGNLTHECYMTDSQYDNLDGYIYQDIYITITNDKDEVVRNPDGTPQQEHHRFIKEIVTLEKMNQELKDVFDKIELKLITTIEKIQTTYDVHLLTKLVGQSHELVKKTRLTREDITSLINIAKTKATAKIETAKTNKYNYSQGHWVRYGILPEILTELLNARKKTNNRLKKTDDVNMKAILNSLQLAYKITANSLYGQTGAKTSAVYFKVIASATTSIGRDRLHYAKRMVEENFAGAEIVYGDTDSIFINFHVKDDAGNEITSKAALVKTIELSKQAAKLINQHVPKPQSIVYEKTLHPLILVKKKKYVGLLYGDDPDQCYLKSMGIVLKRRDNAPIVKIIYGGIIDNIIATNDVRQAIEYAEDVLYKLINGQYSMDKFVISKKLKGNYKNPASIAHKVLADRMAVRDPGNRPQLNDRIPFVYIIKPPTKRPILQGELIEHPEYVQQHNLRIDYLYYLEHQIIKPVAQILNLVMPARKVDKLFNKFINMEMNKRQHRQTMDKWAADSQPETTTTTDDFIHKESDPVKVLLMQTRHHKCKPMDKWMETPVVMTGTVKKSRKRAVVTKCKSIEKWINPDASDDDFEPL